MNTKYVSISVVLLALLVLLFIVGSMWLSPRNEEGPTQISSFDLNPSPTLTTEEEAEPFILEWDIYENEKYAISFEYPKDWKKEEYSGSFLSGATRTAFSPDSLPCKDCTYVDEGYFSLKIFNNETSPKDYAEFKAKVEAVGKNKEIIQIQLNGRPGVLFGNSAAVEYKGWVYDMRLDAITRIGDEKIKTNVLQSKIFTKALTSFKFTDLQFNLP